MNTNVTTHRINSSSGHSRNWSEAGLTVQQQNDLNTIGYTGRLNGVETTQEKYLESISTETVVYRLVHLSSNNMDFSDKSLLIIVEIENV